MAAGVVAGRTSCSALTSSSAVTLLQSMATRLAFERQLSMRRWTDGGKEGGGDGARARAEEGVGWG